MFYFIEVTSPDLNIMVSNAFLINGDELLFSLTLVQGRSMGITVHKSHPFSSHACT